MYKRNSIARDDSLVNTMNRNVSYSINNTTKQKYDKFSLMNEVNPNVEAYNITMPDYVTVSYEVMIWQTYRTYE